jgi:hypothetical protein
MPLLETKGAGSAQGFGLSLGSAEPVYIEQTFSTYLYTGNSSTQTITNDIDLDGEGGLVWLKARSSAFESCLFDTVRGATKRLQSSNTDAETVVAASLTAFTSSGFSLSTNGTVNNSGTTFASWTFRKQPKFFDVVAYTGTGSNTTIIHDLGSVPGCIIVKRTDTTGDWQVYHRANTANPETDYLVLNTTAATADSDTRWNDTLPTSTVFSLGTEATVNASGGTYVAYLFAHDAGGFGLTGLDNVISCGSYTGTGASNGPEVNLGYEPQWVLIKSASSYAGNWMLFDTMRGIPTGSEDQYLNPNLSSAETTSYADFIDVTSTGFKIKTSNSHINYPGATLIYIAIRRGPMKVPTSGTEVFSTQTGTGAKTTNFPVDTQIGANKSGGNYVAAFFDRLRGVSSTSTIVSSPWLLSSSTQSQTTGAIGTQAWGNTGYTALNGATYVEWNFKRAPGFFDVVCDTGTGSAHTITHNLGVVPELMIRKKRSATDNWIVYANNDPTDYLILNTTAATADLDTMWNDTAPTSTVFTVGTNDDVNQNTGTFVTYLFATLAGVSKVGSYTGTGTTLQIDCGFTGGARFVMIKRTDDTGDWYVWDSARGIIAGDDPYLLLNSTAAEVTNTDYVDTYSAGFEISSTAPAAINASGGSFIFFAVA